jgi:hypothetical protein
MFSLTRAPGVYTGHAEGPITCSDGGGSGRTDQREDQKVTKALSNYYIDGTKLLFCLLSLKMSFTE